MADVKLGADGDYSGGAIYMLWDPMIEGAVNSEAKCKGLTTVERGFWYDPNTSVYISLEGWTSGPGGGRVAQDEINGFNPKKSELHWSTVIPELFESWDVLPDPAYLDEEKKAAGGTAHQLAMDATSKGYALNPADVVFGGAVTALSDDASKFSGTAMSAFHSNYASRLAGVFRGQAIVAEVVGHAVLAEQLVWTAARANVMSTAKDAVDAFGRAYPGGHGGGGAPTWLGILGAIASVGTIVVTGGAGAAVLGGISTAAGALGTFADAGSTEVDSNKLDADSPQAVLENVRKALENIKKNIASGEQAIAKGCAKAKSTVHGDLGSYDLGSPALLGDGKATDYEDHDQQVNPDGSTTTVISVNTEKMRTMANTDIPRIQTGVMSARGLLSGALGSVPWDRPGGFGDNPYGAYADLVGELDQLLYDTKWALDHVAERLVTVAHDFDMTDGAVAAAQRDITRQVQADRGGSGAKV